MHDLRNFNMFEVIKSQVIYNFKTGNIFFDIVFTTIILSSLTFLMNKYSYEKIIKFFKKYIRKIHIFGFPEEKLITIESFIRNNKLVLPLKFLGILEYIIKNKDKININELVATNVCITLTDSNVTPTDIIYIPGNNIEFEIYPFIKCTFTQLKEEEYNEHTDKVCNKKYYIINLYTTQKDILYIIDFVKKCENEYVICQENKNNSIKKFFKFDDIDRDGYVTYNTTNYYTSRSFDTVFFDGKEKFIKSLDFFINNEHWFIKKQCPYHLGVMLYGPPGCGKTSFIKSLISYTDRHVLYINLNNIKTCTELESIFLNKTYTTSMKGTTIRNYVIVLEDIDCLSDVIIDRSKLATVEKTKSNVISYSKLVKDLKKIDKYDDDDDDYSLSNDTKDKLNLSFILNLIDGIIEMPGRIIIMTTNHIDKIDPALIRPGRIDFKIEMKPMSKNNICKIIQHYYEITDSDMLAYEPLLNKIKDNILTPAEVSAIVKCSYFENKSIEECISSIEKKINI